MAASAPQTHLPMSISLISFTIQKSDLAFDVHLFGIFIVLRSFKVSQSPYFFPSLFEHLESPAKENRLTAYCESSLSILLVISYISVKLPVLLYLSWEKARHAQPLLMHSNTSRSRKQYSAVKLADSLLPSWYVRCITAHIQLPIYKLFHFRFTPLQLFYSHVVMLIPITEVESQLSLFVHRNYCDT